MKHIKIVFDRFQMAGLTIIPRKTQFTRKYMIFGHISTKNGIKTDPSNIENVKHFPVPKNIRDVRSFVGLSNFYKRFIFGYVTIISSLNNLLTKQIVCEWSNEAKTAFETLRDTLISSPILAFPDLLSNEPLGLTLVRLNIFANTSPHD